MVGRGAYGRPWFLRQVIDYLRDGSRTPAPGLARRVEVMLEHYEALLTLYGRHNGVRIARKQLGWYARGIEGPADFRARVYGDDGSGRVGAMNRTTFAPVLDGDLASAPGTAGEARSRRRVPVSVTAGPP